ncbi:hypothetical protein Hanom_Chr13g01228071 [Helianthus anomalus]
MTTWHKAAARMTHVNQTINMKSSMTIIGIKSPLLSSIYLIPSVLSDAVALIYYKSCAKSL